MKGGALAGDYTFFYISQSGSYSREAHLSLCGSGRFTQRGELAGSGEAGSAVTGHGNAGRWTAAGTAAAGTVTLSYDDGSTATLPYQTSTNPADRSGYGDAVRFGTDLYQKVGAGSGC